MSATELQNCRICQGAHFTEVVNLGNHIITSRFPKVGDTTTPSGLIRLVMCDSCKLVQLKDSTPASEMYEHFYGYRSGINATMRNHLTAFNEELQAKVGLTPGDSVLDIGSNDCTFVGHYPDFVKRHGCDPTGVQFTDFYKATNTTLFPTYFTRAAVATAGPFKAVTSISMFYDLPDPVQFAKDIYSVLAPDGLWALEQSYSATMLERNSIDTICHEHLEYYGVKQVKDIMDRAGFKIIDIQFNDCNGGSFRTYVAKRESTAHIENVALVAAILQKEEAAGIHTPARYLKFGADCKAEADKLVEFIELAKADGKSTYIYGASTKGNCLLQFANLGPSSIPYAVERNLLKVGRTTSTGIEIISEETMRAAPSAFMLVLPWHFRTEIIARERTFLENGGQLIFPFPTFEVYSSKPKTLVTGIDGQIGSFVETALRGSVYGIVSRKKHGGSAATMRIPLDLNDVKRLEHLILLLRPDRIIHLASISNTEECERDPVRTIDMNGRLVAAICDTLYRNGLNCKLFNASSSELYKGHIDYTVSDNDTNMSPSTMYAICKEMGHRIVDSYRSRYNLPFSNGILFTTESKLRSEQFLFKKIANHARGYKQNPTTLSLGSLESWRNLNHAADVADAICLIMDQPLGSTYVVCGTNFHKVEDLVIDMYKCFGIHLVHDGNHLLDKDTGVIVVKIGSSLRSNITKIDGRATQLRQLGWVPKYSTQAILEDLSDVLSSR